MFVSVVEGNRLRARISADIGLIDRVCAEIGTFLADAGLSELHFEFNLMTREALCNAIHHGAAEDASQKVELDLELENHALVLRVRDHGPGWDWQDHEWTPPPPDSEGGRGLYILKNYSDEVRFNEAGNEIVVTKRLQVPEDEMMTMRQDSRREVVMGQALSASTLDDYRSMFKEYVDLGAKELVLNCSALEVVDSMGIGLLVATHNSLAKNGGELVMEHTPEPIYNLMSTMRLNRHFTVRRD